MYAQHMLHARYAQAVNSWCWQPLLVQLVDEESVEEVTLWISIKLAQLDITLL